MKPSPRLEALKAEQIPGRCIACDGPLPPTRWRKPRTKCTDPECIRLYNRAVWADAKWRARGMRS